MDVAPDKSVLSRYEVSSYISWQHGRSLIFLDLFDPHRFSFCVVQPGAKNLGLGTGILTHLSSEVDGFLLPGTVFCGDFSDIPIHIPCPQ